jgi:hypothetical protein
VAGMSATIQGYCPMGCGQTLFMGTGGHITCRRIDCPNPGAVDQILADPETEHLVNITSAGFSILHPLRERLDKVESCLWGCALHRYMDALSGPPAATGHYRVHPDPGGWSWERVPG